MAQLDDLRTQTRRRIGETSSTKFSDDEINDLLNEAQTDFASSGGIVKADRGFALVQNQYLYTPPADVINIHKVMFEEDTKLMYLTERESLNLLGTDPETQASDPTHWGIENDEVRVFPTPSNTSDSTALDGAIDAVVTSITVDDTTGFPKRGRFIVDSEEVHYFNTSATQFLQCVRGQGGTTAASHLDNAVVDEANLRIFYYKDPVAMSLDTDTPDIPIQYHPILPYYAAGMAMIHDQKYAEGQFLLGLYEQKKRDARGEIKKRQRDRNPRVYVGRHDKGHHTSLGAP